MRIRSPEALPLIPVPTSTPLPVAISAAILREGHLIQELAEAAMHFRAGFRRRSILRGGTAARYSPRVAGPHTGELDGASMASITSAASRPRVARASRYPLWPSHGPHQPEWASAFRMFIIAGSGEVDRSAILPGAHECLA